MSGLAGTGPEGEVSEEARTYIGPASVGGLHC